MTDICLGFEVHQPFRLRGNFYWNHLELYPVAKDDLLEYYFGLKTDKEIFLRACDKCYLPSNRILLDQIDYHKREGKEVKICFSISGIFLEQCEMWSTDLIDSFRQLAETGCVEFLQQTYYHTLSSLWSDREEWLEQVKIHKNLLKDLLGVTPTFFENTELLYNNAIAKEVEKLGYRGVLTEGVERILDWRSPNYVYRPINCRYLKVLLRNYRLTDDFGFRFSSRNWSEWPLTADKFANWLASTPGQCINLFADYETFGEHHWPESGIHEFLKHLPDEILKHQHLYMKTPTEVVDSNSPVGEIDVNELGGTISWADLERDTSCWIGNSMQWAFYDGVRRMEPLVKESQDRDLLKIWRYLQTSDHLYYMFTGGGGPGEVHNYFSPYGSPYDAFVTCISILLDFKTRVCEEVVAATSPFEIFFDEEQRNQISIWSLRGLKNHLKQIEPSLLRRYLSEGDIARWIRDCIGDKILAEEFKHLSESDLSSKGLIEEVDRILTKKLQTVLDNSRLRVQRRGLKIREPILSRNEALRILRRLPSWKSFWFSRRSGLEIGESASSLGDMVQKIMKIDDRCLRFHLSRGDLQNWVRNALGDIQLAQNLDKICRSEASLSEIRMKLYTTLKERYNELCHIAEL